MRILASIAGVAAVLAFRWASAEPDHRTRVVEATPDAILSVIENDARASGSSTSAPATKARSTSKPFPWRS